MATEGRASGHRRRQCGLIHLGDRWWCRRGITHTVSGLPSRRFSKLLANIALDTSYDTCSCPQHHRSQDGHHEDVRSELRHFVQAISSMIVKPVVARRGRPLETVPESTKSSNNAKVRHDYPTEARMKQKQREAEHGNKVLPRKMEAYERHWGDCGDDLSSILLGGLDL
eukprot:2517626-Pyramimonas_sp.AAC.1